MINPKEIEFEEQTEKWNYYTLSDGFDSKIKNCLDSVIQEGLDVIGNPYLVFLPVMS